MYQPVALFQSNSEHDGLNCYQAFFLNVLRLQKTRQIGKHISCLQNAFYMLITEEAKNNSEIKTKVSQKVLTVGTPMNMGSFGQKLSP